MVDRLDVLRRKECPEHGADTGLVFSERDRKPRCGHGHGRHCGRKLVEVEYVPAAALRGAVEALERIREDASAVCEQYEPGQLRSEVYALWKLADDALGGQ